MKKVLSIAGSDCSGGAGIQADLKTFSAHGVFGMSVIVSVVAENTSRVIDIQDITPDMIEKQIDAVFEDIEVDAVKIGMLSTPECMKAVAKKLLQYKPQNVVIDPVMYAKNGCPLMNPTAVSTLIDTVIPLADVLTPNIPEAEKIADMQISTVSDMEAAARKIYAMGCKAIVVKGGHHIGNAVDVLFNGENFYHFETSRIDTKNTHGTGCTFSSAIASQLAKGKSVPLAVESAKAYDEIRKQYPETISKDQFYRIAHISKATALYLLQSGLVPCIDSGKKTRRYTIRTEDVITYLMEREIHPEDYRAPEMWYAKRSGRTKPRKKRCNRLKKLSETEKKHFRTYMEAKLEDYDDLLKVADVTEVIGYSSASVHLWCKNKKLQAFRVSGKFLVPKSCFLDFMVSESCFDIRCKTNEHISLVRSFLEQFADGM